MSELISVLGSFASFLPIAVVPLIGILTRISTLFMVLPGIGAQVIPVRQKISIIIAVSFLLLPVIGEQYVRDVHLIALLFGEAAVGLFLGFSARIFIFILSIVGAIVAQSMSLSQIFGAGVSEEANTTISSILTLTGAVLFLTLDLHVYMIGIAVKSVVFFPPGGVLTSITLSGMAETFLIGCGQGFALALAFSMPFLLLNLAYNTLLGVLNRAMPQLMVTFVGLPAITLSGMVLLFSAIGGTMTMWLDAVLTGLERIVP